MKMQTLPAVFIGTLLLGVIVIVATASNDRKLTSAGLQNSTAVKSRLLNFIDHPDGSLEVIDLINSESVSIYASGEGSFVRGVMRSLVRERRLRGNNDEAQFELRLTQLGQLLLIDGATNTTLILNAFGPDNVETFEKLLAPDSTPGSLTNSDIPDNKQGNKQANQQLDKHTAKLRSQIKS